MTPIHLRIFWACAVAACVAIVLGGSVLLWAGFTDASELSTRLVGAGALVAVTAAFTATIWGMP